MKVPTPVTTIDVDSTGQDRDATGRIFHRVKVVAVHHQTAELLADKVQAKMDVKVPVMVSGTDIFFRPEPSFVTEVIQAVAEVANQMQQKKA